MFADEHFGGFLWGPGRGETLGAVGDPESDEGLDRSVAIEDGFVDFVEGVDRRMMGVAIFGRVLIEIDAGEAGENEGAGVGAEFGFVVGGDFAEGVKCGGELGGGGNEVVAATHVERGDGALAVVENDGGDVIGHVGFVSFYVGERTEKAFFFASEKDEANGAERFEAGADDGFGGAESGGDANAVVGGTFGEIPGIEMAADDDDLFGMLGAGNFADNVGGVGWPVGDFVLDVDVEADGFAVGDETLEDLLIFRGDADDRNVVIGIEAERAGMREVHALGFSAALSADDGDSARVMSFFQEGAELGEGGHAVFRSRALLHGHDDFAAPVGGILLFFLREIVNVDGDNVGIDAAGGSGTDPAHGVDHQFVGSGGNNFSVGGNARPAAKNLPGFGVDILQADFLHGVEAPLNRGVALRRASDASANVVAQILEFRIGVNVQHAMAGDGGERGE